MAIYTQLNDYDITQFIDNYNIDQLISYEGISSGVENTNYKITVIENQKEYHYILTIFEYQNTTDLKFSTTFNQALYQLGLPVAQILKNKKQKLISTLNDKPALIAHYLKGQSVKHPISLARCQDAGATLAQIHQKGLELNIRKKNHRSPEWMTQQITRIAPFLDQDEKNWMLKTWKLLQKQIIQWKKMLPCGLIHGDFFHDNVLFYNNKVSGIIDFYQSCYDWFIYDIAIALNDWCLNHHTLMLDQQKTHVFLTSYHRMRPLESMELKQLPDMLPLAAFRFWISRLTTFVYPEFNYYHNIEPSQRPFLDPKKFQTILQHHIEKPSNWIKNII